MTLSGDEEDGKGHEAAPMLQSQQPFTPGSHLGEYEEIPLVKSERLVVYKFSVVLVFNY